MHSFSDAFEGRVPYGAYDPYADRKGLVRIDWDSAKYYYRKRTVQMLGGLRAFKKWFANTCPTDRHLMVSGSEGHYSVD